METVDVELCGLLRRKLGPRFELARSRGGLLLLAHILFLSPEDFRTFAEASPDGSELLAALDAWRSRLAAPDYIVETFDAADEGLSGSFVGRFFPAGHSRELRERLRRELSPFAALE